jgi:hypothetical protein
MMNGWPFVTIDIEKASMCLIHFHFTVSSPYSVPSIDCGNFKKSTRSNNYRDWCKMVHDTFANKERVLPGNVTFGVVHGDWTNPEEHGYGCFGNSGPGGKFTITNFLEVSGMSRNKTFPTLPWEEERHSVPVWRGSNWSKGKVNVTNESSALEELIKNGRQNRRVEAVLFSREHPDLIDAKFASSRGTSQK